MIFVQKCRTCNLRLEPFMAFANFSISSKQILVCNKPSTVVQTLLFEFQLVDSSQETQKNNQFSGRRKSGWKFETQKKYYKIVLGTYICKP